MILKTGRPPRHPRQLFSRPTPPTSATLSAEHTPSRESGFVLWGLIREYLAFE